MDLKNKIALITGAGSGIGKATAIELARYGSTIILVDINEDNLTEALSEVHQYAPHSTTEVCDVSDQSQVKQMIQTAHQRHGSIDILVNNAGIMIIKLFDDLTEDEFNKQMDVNLYGTIYLTRAVVPIMTKQGRGTILNFCSPMAKTIVPGATAYIVSKAGIYAFSEALYYELKDRGIHVGVVLPGGTRTHLFDNAVYDKLGEYYRDHCTSSPAKIARSIRKALEKERFETITQPTDRFYIGIRNLFPGLFRTFAMLKLRPYFSSSSFGLESRSLRKKSVKP